MSPNHDQLPTPEERHEMIAIAAYYLAERRGFGPDGAKRDWFQAERVIDALLAAHPARDFGQGLGRAAIRNALMFYGDADA